MFISTAGEVKLNMYKYKTRGFVCFEVFNVFSLFRGIQFQLLILASWIFSFLMFVLTSSSFEFGIRILNKLK